MEENKSLKELGTRMVRRGLNKGVLGVFVGGVFDLPDLAGLTLGLGAAFGQTALDYKDRLKEIEGNQLYFYYHAKEVLGTNA